MKKTIVLMLMVVLFSVCIGIVGCAKTNGSEEKIQSVVVSESNIVLDVLERKHLSVEVKNTEGEIVKGEQVVWTSSDSKVATVADGIIKAVGAGTADIRATVSGVSGICSVTVNANGIRPQLLLAQSKYELLAGEEDTVQPSVKFKTLTLDESYGITYRYETSDEEIVRVNSAGRFEALSVGEAVITVQAIWTDATAAGLDGGLVGEIAVSVKPQYVFEIGLKEGSIDTVYLQGAKDGDTEYLEYTDVVIKQADFEGENVSESAVFESSNSAVVTVDAQGRVRSAEGAKAGISAEIYLKYTKNGTEYISNKIEINVSRAVVAKTINERTIELTASPALPVEEIFDEQTTVVEVYDSEIQINYWDVETKALKLEEVTQYGNREWIVCGEKIAYRVNFFVVTKLLKTVEDLNMFNINDQTKVFDGYYAMANNIDATEYKHVNKGWNTANTANGLTGTFDGCGYTIDKLTLDGGGFFTKVASTGVVENVALTNVKVNSANSHALVMCFAFYGTMRDVFVEVTEWSSGYANGSVGLFYQTNSANEFINVVMICNPLSQLPSTEYYGALVAATNKGAWENTFVVASMRLFGGQNAGDVGEGSNKYVKSLQKFTSMNELKSSAYYTEKVSQFDENLWDRKTMTFKSSADIYKLDDTETNISVVRGEPMKIFPNANVYVWEIKCSDATFKGYTFKDGILTIDEFLQDKTFSLKNIFAESSKTFVVQMSNTIDFKNQKYEANKAEVSDFIIENNIFTGLGEISAFVKGTNGESISMQAVVSDNILTIGKVEFQKEYLPSGTIDITVLADGNELIIRNVNIIWNVNSLPEFEQIKTHMTMNGSAYYGQIKLNAEIDFTGYNFNNWCMKGTTFAGTFDGGGHTISNMNVTASNSGLFPTLTGCVENLKIVGAAIHTYTACISSALSGGTIKNVYISGNLVKDGLNASSNPANFGAGLMAGRILTGSKIENCIVELMSMPMNELYVAAAFGKLHGGAANEGDIFSNCYAVNAENLAFRAYDATAKNFSTDNGQNNNNFATMEELLLDPAAKVIAEALGVG